MKISFLERFRGQCRSVRREDQAAILKVVLDLETALANPQQNRGMGLRKLHPSQFWEIRVGLSLRALFKLASDEAIFVFLGTHDEVRRFLRTLLAIRHDEGGGSILGVSR